MATPRPKIIPPINNPQDKAVIDSMLERKKKIQEYNKKVENLLTIRQKLVDKVNEVDILIADYDKLRRGIS